MGRVTWLGDTVGLRPVPNTYIQGCESSAKIIMIHNKYNNKNAFQLVMSQVRAGQALSFLSSLSCAGLDQGPRSR